MCDADLGAPECVVCWHFCPLLIAPAQIFYDSQMYFSIHDILASEERAPFQFQIKVPAASDSRLREATSPPAARPLSGTGPWPSRPHARKKGHRRIRDG